MRDKDALRTAITALDGPIFAVLDGAQFVHLPGACASVGLEARALYFDRADNQSERLLTAPQMIGPLHGDILEAVLRLLDEAGSAAAAFWLCASGADQLYRHLRGINMARILKRSALGDSREPAPEGEVTANSGDDVVLFRHADANVLAQVTPAVDASQLARILGPADALFFLPGSDWQDRTGRSPVRIVWRQDDLPKAPSGLLTISGEAMEVMGSRRAAALRVKRIRLLREHSPSLFDGAPEDAILACVESHERSGRSVGLTTERGLLQWTYLSEGSKGRFAEDTQIRSYLATGTGTPDRKLDALMGLMVRAAPSADR